MGATRRPAPTVKDFRLFELERIAAAALAGAPQCLKGLRVDIERLILEKHQLRIEAFHDLKRRWDTYAFIDTTAKVVFVDAELMDSDRLEKKYRFTLAEELAHFLIHQPVFSHCRTVEDRLALEKQFDDLTRDRLESNARALASALLIPKATIELRVEELARKLVDEQRHILVEELIAVIGRDYDVNFNAAKHRLRNLGYRRRLDLDLQ
ncbi:MAG TPA: ImmA/IrrE family metallo-endopeptidase [Verrucomicrobiae bacterium]|nr:ImmA/IrrE family metallo-endopeptidase [Verrucomicrobiae bacterium]